MHETDTTSQHPAHANFDHASVSEKLSAEAGLLSSLPQSAARGLEKRIQNAGSNLPATIAEASCFAVAGCAVGLIVRNPAIVGEACVPLINTASKWAPPIFAGVMGADLAGKTIPSMAKTWNAPASLPDIKIEMGDRIGSTIFDYSLAGIAGSAGHALSGPSERALASIGRRLVQVEERPMAFVAAGGHEIHTRSVEPSAWADYTAFSKPWQKGTAPDSIITSSNIIDAKELQSRPYKSGDILLGTIKSEFGDALRFFTQINVGEAGWRNADFMHRAVAHLYHGVNEFNHTPGRSCCGTLT
jgi:hypothetical protein